MLDATETFCLKLMENLIDRYIRENNAAMIYFHHGLNDWDYHLGSDTTLFKQEMKNLIMQIKNGTIVHVTKGLVVDVKGTQLYPVEIEFKNVYFGYPNTDAEVLRDVSFRISPGKSLAITGGTGSGKSTLALLLMRFCDPTHGAVLVDGIDLRIVSLGSYRRQTGFVPQEVFLFSESVADNVAFGLNVDGDDSGIRKKVETAADAACVSSDIQSFPEGYETMVGERGITLSGGQKQRISLARALIRNPNLLVLDDCLSAVDTITEERILDSLERNLKGKTSVLISHRISTVMSADDILVLDQGRIVEHGTHAELMNTRGFYFEMFERQRIEDKLKG